MPSTAAGDQVFPEPRCTSGAPWFHHALTAAANMCFQKCPCRGPDSHLSMHVRTYAYTPLLRPEAPVQVLGHWAHPPPLRLPGQHTAAGSGRHLELVRPQLVDVGAGSRLWLVPEAELKEQLVSPGQQHLAPLLSELQVLLRVGWGQAIWAQHGDVKTVLCTSWLVERGNRAAPTSEEKAGEKVNACPELWPGGACADPAPKYVTRNTLDWTFTER